MIDKNDNFTYISCVNGHCPLIIEEQLYGVRTFTCKEYCGDNTYCGCDKCYFEGSDSCDSCIHYKD